MAKKILFKDDKDDRFNKAMVDLNITNQEQYKENWDTYNYDRIENDALCFTLLDYSIKQTPARVHRDIQAVIRKDLGDFTIEVTGELDDKTIEAINCLEPSDLLHRYKLRANRA